MPPFLPFLITGLALGLTGWAGLVALILYTLPTIGPRWLFFFLLTLALSGSALPVIHFFHRRFPSETPVDSGVIIREAVLVSIYGNLLAWLQLGKVLNSALTVFLAIGLALVEFFIRLRERTRFKPKEIAPDE